MAVPTITTGAYTGTNSSNQIVLTKPAGAQVGDVFLAVTYTRTTYASSPPAGWITTGVALQSGANPETQAYYRVCDGTEGASFAFAATSFQTGGGIIALIKGADPSNPIDLYTGNLATSGTNSFSPPPITTNSNETLVLHAMHAYYSGGIATLTPGGDVTVHSNGVYGLYAKALVSRSGPALPGTLTSAAWTASTPAFWSNLSIAFRPVQTVNNPPTASMSVNIASPVVNDTVIFNANPVDPEGETMAYAWTILAKPTASNASIASSTSTASVVADEPGVYTLRCVVTDDHNQTATTSLSITVGTRVRFKVANGTLWASSTLRQSTGSTWQNAQKFNNAVTLIGKRFAASSYETALSPAVPDGVAAGDVLYALSGSSTVDITSPAGWTAVQSTVFSTAKCKVWRKIAGSNETAPTFTSPGSYGWGIALYAFRGVNGTTPEAQTAVGGSGLSHETTLGLLTVPTNGSAIMYVANQTSVASNLLNAFNVAKTDFIAPTDTYSTFMTGSETNMRAGVIGRSLFSERFGNCSVIGIVIQP